MTYELLGKQNLSLIEKNDYHIILRRKKDTELECIFGHTDSTKFVLY